MKVYVGNLPYTVDDAGLMRLFSPYGPVDSARVVVEAETGTSKGYGFVEMPEEGARHGIAGLNGSRHGGRTLFVNEARVRPGA